MSTIQIRALKTLKEFRGVERIQLAVWGNLAVGSELMSVTAKYGGAVVGAIANGNLVGFIYAFLARRHGRPIHWSHMMAVEPRFRDRHLGFRMKLVHRRVALEMGIKSICWTYDPLQSRNANLNIHRLGGTVDEYIENCYGRFPSRIEKGLPSDRFVVDWRIGTADVANMLSRKASAGRNFDSLPCANEASRNSRGFLQNTALRLNLSSPTIAVRIPENTDAMRARDMALAERWRLDTRRIFTTYFARGYRVKDFVARDDASGPKVYYVLARSSKPR